MHSELIAVVPILKLVAWRLQVEPAGKMRIQLPPMNNADIVAVRTFRGLAFQITSPSRHGKTITRVIEA